MKTDFKIHKETYYRISNQKEGIEQRFPTLKQAKQHIDFWDEKLKKPKK